MGIPNDILGSFPKDDTDIKGKKQSKESGKLIKPEINIRKRNNSTHVKDNPLLINRIRSQIENNLIKNKIEEEDDSNTNNNIQQNNKIFKSLSYEKLEKIEEPHNNTQQNGINNNLYNGGKYHCSKIEIAKGPLQDYEKEEDIYNEMDNDNSIDEGSDLNSNSNSASNKELQIIDANMKSLFLNPSSKPVKNIKEKKEKEKKGKEKEKKEKEKEKKDNNQNSIINEEKTNIQESEYELNYYRTGDNIRKSYIQKLVSKALYLPNNRPKTHNSLIIFDWDDTLLPTTFLTQGRNFNENIILSENDQKKLEKLENSALNLLNMAITQGDVYIITNAGLGWVEYSAQRFYPKILGILPKIQIISARGEWEKDYPGDSRTWKIQSFLSLQKKLDTKLVTNIICLGDSLFEIEAGRVLATRFGEAFVKTIKFKEGPKLDELNKQLTLVLNQFNSICSAVKNLTIRVEKKKKGQ